MGSVMNQKSPSGPLSDLRTRKMNIILIFTIFCKGRVYDAHFLKLDVIYEICVEDGLSYELKPIRPNFQIIFEIFSEDVVFVINYLLFIYSHMFIHYNMPYSMPC